MEGIDELLPAAHRTLLEFVAALVASRQQAI
jgi:hypothetical protein